MRVDLTKREWLLDELAGPIEAGERIEVWRGDRLVAEIIPVPPEAAEQEMLPRDPGVRLRR